MTIETAKEILSALHAGEDVDHDKLDSVAETQRAEIIDTLIDDSLGRRWLREDPHLDQRLADRLLEYEQDYQATRRDKTLDNAVHRASDRAIDTHVQAIAAGPAARALWNRLAGNSETMLKAAIEAVQHGTRAAGEATLYLLVLDPVESHNLDETGRARIAAAGLGSPEPSVRGLAAEYLAEYHPSTLVERLDRLIRDDDERVRGFAWSAAYAHNRQQTYETAIAILGDEYAPVPQRRSALVATGEHMPTSAITELLAFFVVHPEHALATDAANLLYRLHRHPDIATAASESPHEDVRETAAWLLDPYRGSPAAGGSRPGDPTRPQSDVFAEMLRRMGADEDDETDGTTSNGHEP